MYSRSLDRISSIFFGWSGFYPLDKGWGSAGFCYSSDSGLGHEKGWDAAGSSQLRWDRLGGVIRDMLNGISFDLYPGESHVEMSRNFMNEISELFRENYAIYFYI